MIYILVESNGAGSSQPTLITKEKRKAMAERECTLTYKAIIRKYGIRYFMVNDIKCSTICSYTSERAIREGKPKTIKNWY